MQKLIFISYKRIDKEKVFKIKKQIENTIGDECWIDLDGIESDAQFVNVIINAINHSDVILFMYSKVHSQIIDYENDWTIRELIYANSEKKRIVFINIDNSPLSAWFKFMYGQKQIVNGESKDAIFRLSSDIQKWLSSQKEAQIITEDIKCHLLILDEVPNIKLLCQTLKDTFHWNLKDILDFEKSLPATLPIAFDQQTAKELCKIFESIGVKVILYDSTEIDAEYELELIKVGDTKLQLIKTVKEAFNWHFRDAKDFVDTIPSKVPFTFDKEAVYYLKYKLESSSGTVNIYRK